MSKPTYKQVQLPTTYSQYFDACLQGDGAVNLQLFETEDLVGGADLEWIVDEGKGWRAELVNPVGQSLLQLNYAVENKLIEKAGQLAERLPDFAVDDQGFLRVKGQFVPIRAMEVPCLLKFRFPSRWLDRVTDYQMYAQSAKLQIQEQERSIEMNAAGFAANGPETKVCADISWTRFLGLFRSTLIVCQSYGTPNTGSIRGLDTMSLRWSRIND